MPNALLNSLVKTAKKPTATKQDRPIVDVPDNVLESFKRLVGAKTVFDVAEARLDVESEIVKEEMIDVFAEVLYKNGSVPANPKLQTELPDTRPDCSGIFQVQNRFKFNIPEDVKGNADIAVRFQYALEAGGMSSDAATKLIQAEIDGSPVVSLRPFGELVDGHYEGEGKNKTFIEATADEKAVGQKLLEFVTGQNSVPMTENERSIAIRIVEKIKIKEGFLQRLKSYCDSEATVKAVLKVITPTHYVSHMKLGISDTPAQRQNRLKTIALDIVGKNEETVKLKKVA